MVRRMREVRIPLAEIDKLIAALGLPEGCRTVTVGQDVRRRELVAHVHHESFDPIRHDEPFPVERIGKRAGDDADGDVSAPEAGRDGVEALREASVLIDKLVEIRARAVALEPGPGEVLAIVDPKSVKDGRSVKVWDLPVSGSKGA